MCQYAINPSLFSHFISFAADSLNELTNWTKTAFFMSVLY